MGYKHINSMKFAENPVASAFERKRACAPK